MEWTYKTVHIAVNGEGFFCAKVNNKSIRTLTLNECKKEIDNALDNYYRFTKNDWNNLLQKLSPREKQCLTDIKEELKCHICNNYCELGICDKTWDWQFLDDNKLNF